MTTPVTVSVLVFILALQAERIHARRIWALGLLAFGRDREASMVNKFAPLLRAAGIAFMTWGLAVLLQLPAQQRLRDPNAASNIDPRDLKRVLLVLDVSPSMRIKDAAGGKLTRAQRAADVLMNLINRVDFNKTRVTIAAFYTGVKPVVIDAVDPNVIEHIVENNTLDQAFEDGETDLGVAVRGAYDLAKDWRPASTTLMIVTDGDSTPIGELPTRPPSINRALLLGVGDTDRGTFIDNHVSRQDAVELQNIASQLGGTYADADGRFVPTDLLNDLSGRIESLPPRGWSLREFAIAAVDAGAVLLCSVPMLLAAFGTRPTSQSVGTTRQREPTGASA